MDLDLGAEVAAFRSEIREWIAAHAPAGLAELADWNRHVSGGGYGRAEIARAMTRPLYQQWEQRLTAFKLICPHWPTEYGGRGMDGVRLAVFNEELYRAGLPRVLRGMGEWLVGPAVIVHGTSEQRAFFLPRIISGEDVYCQGFSEPDHGSDLAGVQTRAEVDGDEVVITGTKVWTSGAARATMMFALCRSYPEAPKHQGLSYVLLPFRDPRVEYSPIRQMSGASEFCQDYLNGVRVPLFNVIGGLNNGWKVAMTTLGYERGGQVSVQYLGYEREFWELVDAAKKYGRDADPLIRHELARAYTGVQIMKFNGLRSLAAAAEGRPPGPEASIAKLVWSEYHKRLGELAMRIVGTDALVRPDGPGYPTTAWQDVFLASRAGTIYSGTSEIQRGIVGERVLGLPKEPRVPG